MWQGTDGQEESMRTVGRGVGLIAAVLAAGWGGVACGRGTGDSGRTTATSFGHMAGYVWAGPVTSVAASWSVPGIAAGSGEAHASTWIGAQAPGPSMHTPFIQVGTLEDRGSATAPSYAAFWTDTTRGFHPQVLFPLRPGDAVSTSLTLSAGRWVVSIVDSTSGRRASFTTDEEGDAAFNLAEWLQENPSQASGRMTRYPHLSTVRMSALRANDARPPYADVFAQWMSLPGRDLAPTPLRGDAFEITRAVLSAAGRRYLLIARAQDALARRIDQQEASWTPSTPPGEIRRANASAAASQRTYAGRLDRGTWPAAARPLITSLARQVRREAALLAQGARHAPASLAAWRRQFVGLTPTLLRLAHEVRRTLHVPELVAGQLPAGR
jgi:peptidase A4-like protein